MRVGRPARLAWSLAGACVALVLGSLVLLLAASHAGDTSQYYYEDAAVAVAFALLAWAVGDKLAPVPATVFVASEITVTVFALRFVT